MREVWIVDDDEEMTRAIQLMLRLLDCEATGFLNARSTAQSLLSGKTPDLLIVDIHMPEVSGLDLLEFLRRRPEWKDLPILMLSSEAADVTIDRAMELGADGYICKPVTLDELEQAIHTAFQKHQKGLP